MINLDLFYVKRKSLWLDLKIIARTPIAILRLVWEMKIQGISPLQQPADKRWKAAGQFAGTVPANQ